MCGGSGDEAAGISAWRSSAKWAGLDDAAAASVSLITKAFCTLFREHC